MPRSPLLSTYRAGENRVTSSTLAVFERIDLILVQELLESATGSGGELVTVTFQNQVVLDGSVPDARIAARFSWWFETKTVRGAYAVEGHGREQVRSHARLLEGVPEACLFVLTPDAVRPGWFDQLDGVEAAVRERVLWFSFRDLAGAVDAVIGDPARLLGEQTRFLLAELVALYEADGLLSVDDTVIVAARVGWPEYGRYGAYVCQPGRAFREGLTHFGFYFGGEIQPVIARIRAHHPVVMFSREEADAYRGAGQSVLADLVDRVLDDGARAEGEQGVFLLSAPEDPDTVMLRQPIVNTVTTAAGRPWAWTLGQRYTQLQRLTSGVNRTSDL
jgi:hypothetical protein